MAFLLGFWYFGEERREVVFRLYLRRVGRRFAQLLLSPSLLGFDLFSVVFLLLLES